MSDNSAIEWTDATWNPVRGCDKVSPGCKNCYAETFAERWRGIEGHPFEHGFDLRLVPEALDKPLRWKKPRRIFVNSMSDLFHERVSFEYIAAVFGAMAASPQHTFQVLTKRASRMVEWFSWLEKTAEALSQVFPADDLAWRRIHLLRVAAIRNGLGERMPGYPALLRARWPLPNVHLGVSCEDQANADARIPLLLQCPAAVRFVSAEPLLGAADLSKWTWPACWHWAGGYATPELARAAGAYAEQKPQALVAAGRPFLSWAIVGGESGPGARPCNVAWIRSIVEQGKASGTPVFVKQLGANVRDSDDAEFFSDVHPPAIASRAWPMPVRVEADPDGTHQCFKGAPVRVRLRDSKGGDPSEWPADLRVREFPRQADQT